METTNYQPSTINQQASDEISLKELIQKISEWFAYLKTQWWKIAIAGMIGGALGFVYAWMQPITYTAKTTFVVEDAKSGGGLSGLASLAGQFGVDVGGGGSGLIDGDNILFYFKSESLARQVLLSAWDTHGNKSYADEFVNIYKLNKSWGRNLDLSTIKFPVKKDISSLSRTQDSLLQILIRSINKNIFSIARLDKKTSLIEVKVTSNFEEWSKRYCDKIVEVAVKRYLLLKTERQQKTVEKLQTRLDSINALLNKKTNASAVLQTASITMDMNPLYKTNTAVVTELTNRDKAMLNTVYGEVIKNLELAKFTLSQETPVIQIIDNSTLPLPQNVISKKLYFGLTFFIGAIFYMMILVIRKLFNNE